MTVQDIAGYMRFSLQDFRKFIDSFFGLSIFILTSESKKTFEIEDLGVFTYNAEEKVLSLDLKNFDPLNLNIEEILRKKLLENF